MKTTILSAFCTAICFAISVNAINAQGTDHLTMTLQNASQTTDSTIQFDIYVVSDGDNTSDLRANSFQAGINFNPSILQTGSAISCSYVPGSTDFPQLEAFNFPSSPYNNHIRIIQSAHNGPNTGVTMIIGHSYKIGTFLLTSSALWVAGQTPDFLLQSATDRGKTICGATVWQGTSATVIGATIPNGGTEARKRIQSNTNSNARTSSPKITTQSLAAVLQRIPLSTDTSRSSLRLARQTNELGLSVYPNPSRNSSTLSFQSKVSGNYHLSMTDATNKEILAKDGKAVNGANQIEIDLNKFAKGVYMVNLKSGDFSSSVRMVIQ